MQTSTKFSYAASTMNAQNELKSIEASTLSELTRHRDAVANARSDHSSALHTLADLTTTVRDLEADRSDAQRRAKTMASLADGFGARGVQTFVLRNTVRALRTASQSYLDELGDGAIRLGMELDDGDRIVRSAKVLGPEGDWIERPLSALSGGQWRRCSFAMSLGFSDLVARRGRLRSSILVLDEPLTHLDSAGRDDVGRLLRRMLRNPADDGDDAGADLSGRQHLGLGGLQVSTIVIILQDLVAEELSESFDRVDEVVRTGGSSELVLDGGG